MAERIDAYRNERVISNMHVERTILLKYLKIYLDIDPKIIWMDYIKIIYIGNWSIASNAAKHFAILQ